MRQNTTYLRNAARVKAEHGFTLLEILLVVGFSLILGGLTLAMLFGRRNVSELNDTTKKMATTLREAQSRSVSQIAGAQWGVRFDNTSPSPFFTIFSGQGYEMGATALSRNALPSTVVYIDPPAVPPAFNNKEITFNQIYGTPSAADFKIVVALSSSLNETSSVSVLSTGAIAYDLLECSISQGCIRTTVVLPPGLEGQGVGGGGGPQGFGR